MVRVEIASTIADIGESSWNAIVPDDAFYSSYRWIHSHERLPGMKSAYLRLLSGSDLVALAPISLVKHELSDAYSHQHFGEVFAERGVYAVLGPRRGYRNSWLIGRDTTYDERGGLIQLLADSALDVAAGWGADAVVAPYLTEEAVAGLADVRALRGCREVGTEAVLDLPGSSFDDYLMAMSSKSRRTSIRRERAKLGRSKLAVQVERPDANISDRLADLIAQVETRHGRRVTSSGLRRYLKATFEDDPDHARLFTCRNPDGVLISATLTYEWGPALFVRAIGTDYPSVPPGSFTHFNVTYYGPIDYCAARGLHKIYFGVGAMSTKLSRGCRERRLYHALLRR